MFSLTLYYIKSLMIFPLQKYPYHSSAFWYCFRPLFGEFAVIVGLPILCLLLSYFYSFNIILLLSFILLCAFIVRILILDLKTTLTQIALCDVTNYLEYDFRKNIYSYGPHYAYFQEMQAYHRYRKYNKVDVNTNNTRCTICQDEFNKDPIGTQKQLLFCGHLYHQACLEEHQNYMWANGNENENSYKYPYCKCPNCRVPYHSHFERYQYDEKYENSVSDWYPQHNYCAANFLRQNIWSRYDSYGKTFDETQKIWRRERGWPLPTKCGGC